VSHCGIGTGLLYELLVNKMIIEHLHWLSDLNILSKITQHTARLRKWSEYKYVVLEFSSLTNYRQFARKCTFTVGH